MNKRLLIIAPAIIISLFVVIAIFFVVVSNILYNNQLKEESKKQKNVRLLTDEEEEEIENDCINALSEFSLWIDDYMHISVYSGWDMADGSKDLTDIFLFFDSRLVTNAIECSDMVKGFYPILKIAYPEDSNVFICAGNIVFVNGYYDTKYDFYDTEYKSPYEK